MNNNPIKGIKSAFPSVLQNQDISATRPIFMTIKEISNEIGVPERTIHNAIDRLFPGLKLNGRITVLNSEQVAALVKEVKKAHNSDLASTGKLVTTDLEMEERILQDMAWMAQKVQIMRERLALVEPKAEAFDNFIKSDREMSITDAAKHFGFRQTETFSLLKTKGYLTERSMPTSKAINENILTIREVRIGVDSTGEPKYIQQAVVHAIQLDNFRKVLIKHLGNRAITA